MSTQLPILYTADKVQAHRDGKRRQIEKYFSEHLGELVSSRAAHMRWGSSFRTRVSDINRDKDSAIFISNEVKWSGTIEESCYWGNRK